MRTFDEYFEIFFVKHLNDKDFPLMKEFESRTQEGRRQSILSMRKYFENFWNEAAVNAAVEKYEKRITELKEKIDSLEEDNRSGLDTWDDETGERSRVALPVYRTKK